MVDRRCTVLIPLLLLSAALGGEPERPGEWVKEIDQAPDVSLDLWSGTVVRAETREPIAGATVSIMAHERPAVPDRQRAHRSAKTDSEGRFAIPYRDLEGQYEYCVVDAPGFAPSTEFHPPNEALELWPGEDVPILLLNHVGRPVPGARVSYNRGCGHIPDHRSTVTDENGRAVLEDIDPFDYCEADIWVEKEGLHRGTTRLSGPWRPGDPPVIIHSSSGIVVEGQIVDPKGEPQVGVLVGTRFSHRPWARTNAAGEFRLVGVEPFALIGVLSESTDWQPDIGFTAPPSGIRRTFVLPDGNSEKLVRVMIIAEGASGDPVQSVSVATVRQSDGWTDEVGYGSKYGVFELDVPYGDFEVHIDGGAGPWGTTTLNLSITPDGPREFNVVVPRLPRLRLDSSRLPEGESLTFMLTTPWAWRRFTLEDLEGGLLAVPWDSPAAVRVAGQGLAGSW